MLMAFFAANWSYPSAHQYTYQEFPQHFVWHREPKVWHPQQTAFAIGHLYFVAPMAGEQFYLRMLLTTVKGPTLWYDLCTFDNVLHLSFHTVCLTCGLLQNDNEWRQCLTEAAGMCSGDALHHLLALVLKHCKLVQPWCLWDEFKANLCDDLHHSLWHMDIFNLSDSDVYDYGLFLLNTKLADLGTSLSAFPNMPHIDKD
jgi:hypothetical protein